ncbi:hypothetical protein [uncultured Ilyobacter sp.]|uniref:hypothetical protein n=1 Tax=uncultured Ilyobacter sp. TaxID=544433 RepID=UPI002AA8BDAD|nr:hypothetical protein [uncultured Ilyobacter sp.]
MKKYIFILFLFIVSLNSFGKRNIYLIVHKDTKVESGDFFVSAMDTSGNNISDITTSEYSSGDYKTIKIAVDVDTDEKIKVAAGYKWEGGGDYDDYYVLLANEDADGFEEVRDTIVENDSDGVYDYLDILNTSYYSTYASFPGVEVKSDMRFFAMPVRDDSSNISSNILTEIPFPAPFEIVDGEIITTDNYHGTAKIIASEYTQKNISGAVAVNGVVQTWSQSDEFKDGFKEYYESLGYSGGEYTNWTPGESVSTTSSDGKLVTNSVTEMIGTNHYSLIGKLSVSLSGGAGDVITVYSRQGSGTQKWTGNEDQIIDDTDSFTGEYIFVKKDGDTILPIPGLNDQTSYIDFVQDEDDEEIALEIPEDQDASDPDYYNISMGTNDALLLFEHGGSYSATQSYSDMQDLVVLIKLYSDSGESATMTFITDEGVEVDADTSMITNSSGSERQRDSNIGIKIMDASEGTNSFKIKSISK